jgi:hypothetical protein
MKGLQIRETTPQARATPDGQRAPRTGGRNEPDGGSRIVPRDVPLGEAMPHSDFIDLIG